MANRKEVNRPIKCKTGIHAGPMGTRSNDGMLQSRLPEADTRSEGVEAHLDLMFGIRSMLGEAIAWASSALRHRQAGGHVPVREGRRTTTDE